MSLNKLEFPNEPITKRSSHDDDTLLSARRERELKPKEKTVDKKEVVKETGISRAKSNEPKKIEINEESFPDSDENKLDDVIEKESIARGGSSVEGLSRGFIARIITSYNERSDKKLNPNDPESFKLVISRLGDKGIKYEGIKDNEIKLGEYIDFLENN